jgi:hypothetical protein
MLGWIKYLQKVRVETDALKRNKDLAPTRTPSLPHASSLPYRDGPAPSFLLRRLDHDLGYQVRLLEEVVDLVPGLLLGHGASLPEPPHDLLVNRLVAAQFFTHGLKRQLQRRGPLRC